MATTVPIGYHDMGTYIIYSKLSFFLPHNSFFSPLPSSHTFFCFWLGLVVTIVTNQVVAVTVTAAVVVTVVVVVKFPGQAKPGSVGDGTEEGSLLLLCIE